MSDAVLLLTLWYLTGLIVMSVFCYLYEKVTLIFRPNPMIIALGVWVWPLALFGMLMLPFIGRKRNNVQDIFTGETVNDE